MVFPPTTIDKDLSLLLGEELNNYKATEIIVYNVIGKVNYTDYIVLATANSMPHAKALFNQVHLFFKKAKIDPLAKNKRLEQRNWIVCDYIDLVVHIFLPEERKYYHLEDLFQECEVIYPPDYHAGTS